MIDWFRGEIEFAHYPLPAGRVLSIEADGSVAWDCVKSIECRSSHETNLMTKSVGSLGYGIASSLMIDGNLSKFLQGHNVFGSRDLNSLLLLSFRKIFEIHNEHLNGWSAPELAESRIKRGDYKVKMIDVNQFYDVGNDASVEAWLHAAEMRACTRHGRSRRDKGTVYLGQYSRRWSAKFYNKWREMQAKGKSHQLPEHLEGMGLEAFTEGKLRAELRLFGKELEERHGITHGYHLNPDIIHQLFNYYLGKIDMTQQATLIDEQLMKMPNAVRGTYQLWRQGADMRGLMRASDGQLSQTFYRHRKILLEFGIDINAMHLAPEHNNIVPLMRIIEAVPVQNPAWAYERGLIAA